MKKSIHLFFLLLCAVLLGACAYHNHLPRGIFAAEAADPLIQKSVVVASDKIAQKQFVFKDYHEKNSVHSYKIDLTDGSLAAAADALATLFDRVEVNPSKKSDAYDYRAELHYTVADTKTNGVDSVQWLSGQSPVLETRVTLYLYDTRTDELVFSLFASRQSRIETTDATAAAQRVKNKGTTLLLPATAPVYTQQFGDNLRYTLTRDLTQCLTDISNTLQRRRALFE